MNAEERAELVRRVSDAIDDDVRLLVLATAPTKAQFDEQLPGIRDALARRAVGAIEQAGCEMRPF